MRTHDSRGKLTACFGRLWARALRRFLCGLIYPTCMLVATAGSALDPVDLRLRAVGLERHGSCMLHSPGPSFKYHLEDMGNATRFRYPLPLPCDRSYYRGTDGCLLVFDITDRASFEALPRWLDEARTNSANPDLSVMLIANKADLAER